MSCRVLVFIVLVVAAVVVVVIPLAATVVVVLIAVVVVVSVSLAVAVAVGSPVVLVSQRCLQCVACRGPLRDPLLRSVRRVDSPHPEGSVFR